MDQTQLVSVPHAAVVKGLARDGNSNKILTARQGSKTARSSDTIGGLVHDNDNRTPKDSNKACSSNTVGGLVHTNGNGTSKDSNNNNNNNGTPKACSSNTPPAVITGKEGASDADINAWILVAPRPRRAINANTLPKADTANIITIAKARAISSSHVNKIITNKDGRMRTCRFDAADGQLTGVAATSDASETAKQVDADELTENSDAASWKDCSNTGALAPSKAVRSIITINNNDNNGNATNVAAAAADDNCGGSKGMSLDTKARTVATSNIIINTNTNKALGKYP